MAKQVGPLFVTGTIDGIIFYKLNGQYYMRSKGDYKNGKQMRKGPRLKRTMQNADRFEVASKLVKRVYHRHLPKAVCKPGLFSQLTGMVNKWLYQGKSTEEAKELLLAHCQTLGEKHTAAIPVVNEAVPEMTLQPAPTKVNTKPATTKPSITQPAVVKPAPPAAPPLPGTETEKRVIPTGNRQLVTEPHHQKLKNPRYLSRWKVKRCGRLQISGKAKPLPVLPPTTPDTVPPRKESVNPTRLSFHTRRRLQL